MYSFDNLNDYFKNDIENINKILEDIDKLSDCKRTKKIALEDLQCKLREYLERIKR